MESKQQKSAIKDPICVSKIYEHVKSRKFLEQLCLECIEGVKQKPAYLNMKQMIDRLLTKTMKNSGKSPSNDADRISSMRMQVAECGMLAYTIDCVVAEVVCNKLEKEYYSMVKDIVKELSAEHELESNLDASVSTGQKSLTLNLQNKPSNKTKVAFEKSNVCSEGVNSINGNNKDAKSKNVLNVKCPDDTNKAISKDSIKNKSQDVDKAKSKDNLKIKCVKVTGTVYRKIVLKPRPQEVQNKADGKVVLKSKGGDGKEMTEGKDILEKMKDGAKSSDLDKTVSKDSDNVNDVSKNIVTSAANSKDKVKTVVEDISTKTKATVVAFKDSSKDAANDIKAIVKNVSNYNSTKENDSLKVNSKNGVETSVCLKSNDGNMDDIESEESQDVGSPAMDDAGSKSDDSFTTESRDDSCFSMGSVSPVHTSDLSSFDDLISLPSGDDDGGNIKKKIRLKDANEIFLDGKLPELYRKKKRGKPRNSTSKKPSPSSKASTTELISSSDEESTPRKSLPQRNRKPNSKYASDIYNCSLKPYSSEKDCSPASKDELLASELRSEIASLEKQENSCIVSEVNFLSKGPKSCSTPLATEHPSMRHGNIDFIRVEDNTNVKKLNPEQTVRKRGRPRKVPVASNIPSEMCLNTAIFRKPVETLHHSKFEESDSQVSSYVPSKKLKNDPVNSQPTTTESPSKEKSSKRYESTDLYKPRPLIPTFGNRGSRAVTLCSTP